LREYTRAQMDVDEQDLPDRILNVYLQEAFDRTMAMTNKWPRTETTWQVALIPGLTSVTLPPDLNIPGLISVLAVANGYRLSAINQEAAETNYANLNDASDINPLYFSVWGNQMYLWPRLAKAEPFDLLVRGYRQPVWTNAASDIPDLDPRLHVTLAYFALSLAYAQQEDDVLEAAYLARWNRDLMQQLKSIMEPVHSRPLVMHGGSPVGGVPSYVVFPPGP
jgi:hypothetical protein